MKHNPISVGTVYSASGPAAVTGLAAIEAAVQCAERRLRSWRIPPRWSRADWFEEMRQIAFEAAWMASVSTPAPETERPPSVMTIRRVVAAVLTVYRREWGYANRIIAAAGSSGDAGEEQEFREGMHCDAGREVPGVVSELRQALDDLSPEDSWLLKEIYFVGRTEADLAEEIGVSQRTVSTRKRNAIERLLVVLGS